MSGRIQGGNPPEQPPRRPDLPREANTPPTQIENVAQRAMDDLKALSPQQSGNAQSINKYLKKIIIEIRDKQGERYEAVTAPQINLYLQEQNREYLNVLNDLYLRMWHTCNHGLEYRDVSQYSRRYEARRQAATELLAEIPPLTDVTESVLENLNGRYQLRA